MPVIDVEKLIQNRVNAIREYHKKSGIVRAQLDVSGGVDSAVMLGLLAKAVGPDNITAVYSNINSSQDSYNRANDCAYAFDVPLINLDVTGVFNLLIAKMEQGMDMAGYDLSKFHDMWNADPTIMGSIRSCIRAPIGRGLNRMTGGGIRHGTGNECEDRWLRFYQKGGDGEVDTNPLAMLSKGEVFQLGIGLGVPHSVLAAVPSPDLQGTGDTHNDEDELRSLTGVDWTYSKVLLQDVPDRGLCRGSYSYVGTIERMSRYLDELEIEYNKLHQSMPSRVEAGVIHSIASEKAGNKTFPGLSKEELQVYIDSKNKIDRQTRHKMNPNCPSLGSRQELLWPESILTNELPNLN